MTTRPARPEDIPILQSLIPPSLPYPALDSRLIEHIQVVVDDEDRPVMAVIAHRIVELYLISTELPPHSKLHGIRLLHESTAPVLRLKGYTEANCFLPPSLAKSFGRRLMRTFGWAPNWPSWFRRL